MSRRLQLERRGQENLTPVIPLGSGAAVQLTPPVGGDYWSYRVMLTDRQAVVGFPKFGTIGIGFAAETDWNTNLPYTTETIGILSHIWHNLIPEEGRRPGPDEDFPDDECPDDVPVIVVYRAIELIQQAIVEDHPDMKPAGSVPSFSPYGWDLDEVRA